MDGEGDILEYLLVGERERDVRELSEQAKFLCTAKEPGETYCKGDSLQAREYTPSYPNPHRTSRAAPACRRLSCARPPPPAQHPRSGPAGLVAFRGRLRPACDTCPVPRAPDAPRCPRPASRGPPSRRRSRRPS